MCHIARKLTRRNNESATEEGAATALPPLMCSHSDLVEILSGLNNFGNVMEYCV